MKRVTEQQLQEHAAASRRGALEGTLVGGSIGGAISYWAHRNLASYRRLPPSLKVFGIIILTAPALSIQAERRGLEYDQSQWEGETVRLIDEQEVERERKWEALSLWDKVGDWSYRHQYSMIMGSWAASLGIAAAVISRQKYQTYPQKIVQARMWAQGLTIGVLIAAGALSQARRAEAIKRGNTDHSWKDILDQQDRDRKEEAAYAAHMKQIAATHTSS